MFEAQDRLKYGASTAICETGCDLDGYWWSVQFCGDENTLQETFHSSAQTAKEIATLLNAKFPTKPFDFALWIALERGFVVEGMKYKKGKIVCIVATLTISLFIKGEQIVLPIPKNRMQAEAIFDLFQI